MKLACRSAGTIICRNGYLEVTDTLRSMRAATISASAAHALAWVACIWFVFAPTYEGVTATATRPGEPASESIRHTATMIEMNGLGVVQWLLLPVVFTGIALWGVHCTRQTGRRVLLWTAAVLLLGFCAVSIYSIGAFYLPAALSLLIAAITNKERRAPAPSGQLPAG